MQVIRKILVDVIAWDAEAKFIIPRWQRHYDWGNKEVQQMWGDWKFDCARDRKHFCGVMLFRLIPESPGSWEIVDGQQRMTTFFLFFLALRDICGEEQIDFSELSGVFTLPGSTTCRLVLQEGVNEDREVMNALLSQTLPKVESKVLDNSVLYSAYRIFRTNLAEMPRSEIPSFVVKILQNLDLVVLTVDESDDTRRIFEALNSRGKQVSPDDLVSNLITYTGVNDLDLNERAKSIWNYVSNLFDHDELALFLDTFANRSGQRTERGSAFDEIKFEVEDAG